MNENHSLSLSSVDDFTTGEDSTEDVYSVYTGLTFRRRFLPYRLGKPCCKVSSSFLKNARRVLLTNVAVSVSIIIIVLSLSLGLGLGAFFQVEPRPSIDYSLKAFSIPNHEVTRHQEALDVAVEDYKKRHSGLHKSRRSASLDAAETNVWRRKRYAPSASQYYRHHKILLVYMAVGGSSNNIFTRERIATILRIETDIVRMPGFSEVCYRGYPATGGSRQELRCSFELAGVEVLSVFV